MSKAGDGSGPLPIDLPTFAKQLIETGEAFAYLHLSGNHAAKDRTKDLEEIHTYTAWADDFSRPIGSFSYKVLGDFGSNDGMIGRAIAYEPLHDPDRVVIAFRAARNSAASVAEAHIDVDNMLDHKVVCVDWLPRDATLSRGVARHAGSVWGHAGSQGFGKSAGNGGIFAFLQGHCQGKQVHFTGLSLAGALAQAIALRTACDEKMDMSKRCSVLTFGATMWGNQALTSVYENKLGPRAAHLVTSLMQRTDAPVHADGLMARDTPWWVPVDGSDGLARVFDPLTLPFMPQHKVQCNTFVVHDPECVAQKARFDMYDDHLAFWAMDRTPRCSTRATRVSEWPTSLVGREALKRLLKNELLQGEEMQLQADYLRLHRGKAYLFALRALFVAARDRAVGVPALPPIETQCAAATRSAAAQPKPELVSEIEALFAPVPEDTGFPLDFIPWHDAKDATSALQDSPGSDSGSPSRRTMRRNSSKRRLEEMLMAGEDACSKENVNGSSETIDDNVRRRGLERLTTSGSFAAQLNEISMF